MAKDINVYRQIREKLGISREDASEMLHMSVDKLVRIETNRQKPTDSDVALMAEVYRCPRLYNHFCSNECEIGAKTVAELNPKELSQIVLEILASLNGIEKRKDRLVEIAVDGEISADEIRDLVSIRNQLGNISSTVDSLKLWVDEALIAKGIDPKTYDPRNKK